MKLFCRRGFAAPQKRYSKPTAAKAPAAIFSVLTNWQYGRVRILPGAKYMVTVNRDKTLKIWGFPSGKLIESIHTDISDPRALAVSDDGGPCLRSSQPRIRDRLGHATQRGRQYLWRPQPICFCCGVLLPAKPACHRRHVRNRKDLGLHRKRFL